MSALRERVLTAAALAPLAILMVLWLDSTAFALGLALIFGFGLSEWARLIGLHDTRSRLALLAANAIVVVALWQWRSQTLFHVVILIGVAWWLLAALWLGNFSFAAQPGWRNLGLKVVAGSLIVIPAWVAAIELHDIPTLGPWWMLFVVVLVWCADIGAFFSGRRFGNTKLAPQISPGKTRAGAYGALAGCAVYALAAGIAIGQAGQPLLLLVLLSLLAVVASIVGDLFESLIKRHSNCKDSGAVFPGHGGVFDRLDSLFAALPVFVAGKLLLGL